MQEDKVLLLCSKLPLESGQAQNWTDDRTTSLSNQFCFDSSKPIFKHKNLLYLSAPGKGNMAGVKMHMSRMFLCCK